MMYLGEKAKKQETFVKRKSLRYKVRFTYSDVNRIQQQTSTYRMVHPEFLAYSKPQFRAWNMDKMHQTARKDMEIRQVGAVKKALFNIFEKKHFERGEKRTMSQALMIIQRFFMYIESWEFVNSMDLENDFHINHSISNMHMWLIYQRLRDFSENKFA